MARTDNSRRVTAVDIEAARRSYVGARGTDRESAAYADLQATVAKAKHEWWEERAAIREYDGGMSRADAEAAAHEDVNRD